jgi:tetratricopeptide (TPR) repeat protein
MMRLRRFWPVLAVMVAIAVPVRSGWADTAPGIWDIAKDPGERERWALHVRIERLLHAPIPEDVLPFVQKRREEIELEHARTLLEDAQAEGSPDVRLRFDLGIVYWQIATLEGRTDLYRRVIDILVPALDSAPEHPAATRALEAIVEAYTRLDRPRDEVAASRRYLDHLTDDRARALTMMNMGEAEMRLGRLDEAMGTFQSVLRICGTLPNSSTSNLTYALTLWDLAVALDRSGDPRAGIETAARARQLTWDEPGPRGLPQSVTGWDAIRDPVSVFFVPDWEREWYLALGSAAAARGEQDARAAVALWTAAEDHWATYATQAAATRDDRWLAIARVRRDRAHSERTKAEARAAKLPPAAKTDEARDAEHQL